jgi:hypothetical protein
MGEGAIPGKEQVRESRRGDRRAFKSRINGIDGRFAKDPWSSGATTIVLGNGTYAHRMGGIERRGISRHNKSCGCFCNSSK